MKTLPIWTAILSAALAGCGGDPAASSPPSTNEAAAAGNPLTAPVDYLGAVGKAQKAAVRTVDLASLQKAIQQFQAAEDRFPASLNELVSEDYLPRLPSAPQGRRFSYDPARGEVKLVAQ